jgi:TPR repeat protein
MFGFIKKIIWVPVVLVAMLIFSPATWLHLMWLRIKAFLGNAEDAAQLGDYYYEESLDTLLGGRPEGESLALKWYRKAAERGDSQLKSQQLRLEKIKAEEPWRVTDNDGLCCYAAERGHQQAISELMYRGHINRQKYPTFDYRDAFYWSCRNADLGNLKAQNHLGAMYSMGKGTHQNDELAVKWYREAAEAGNPEAQFNLGHMYECGLGVARNFSEAAIWYHRAATVLPRAQAALAEMYARGHGVRKDLVQGYMWAGLAVANGNTAARRDYFGRELTHEQIDQAKRLIAEWNPFTPWRL